MVKPQRFLHFKSGTDIRGIALEGVEGQHVDLTDEVIEKLGAAFALWLSAVPCSSRAFSIRAKSSALPNPMA